MKLDVRFSGPDETSGLQAYDLRVEVLNATDMTSKIFVYQRKVVSATDEQANELGDTFVSVADPVDLEQYPADTPDIAGGIPYYRTDNVDMRFRSMAELQDVRERIDADITGLIYALQVNETLVPMEDKTYE